MAMKDRVGTIKNLRKEGYRLLAGINIEKLEVGHAPGGRELALAATKLQESRMWLGQVLGEIGNELPEEFQDKN